MSETREIKVRGFITYNDVQSQHINSNGQPIWEGREWNVRFDDDSRSTRDCYLSRLLEEFGLHNDVEVIIRRADCE